MNDKPKTYKIRMDADVTAASEREAVHAVSNALTDGMPEGIFASKHKITGMKEMGRADGGISVFAGGTFEFRVQMRQPFSGRESMGEFLRIAQRDVDERIQELLRDPAFRELCVKKGFSMTLMKMAKAVTATFEVKK
ncbi:MAG: hypothetical protein DRQ64_00375 [Gammaproteobacteria bacterium]|nr:MAG: hypothetical protein DRQ64_00375 [Gammaproteobacteria bacterium]